MNARAYLLASLSSLALVATPAMAQDAAAEDDGNIIIVTATKRDANLQDIPFSINAQTADRLRGKALKDSTRGAVRALSDRRTSATAGAAVNLLSTGPNRVRP